MSKRTITRTCGHTEEVQIYGPHKDRDRKAEYEATRMCYDCYKADQAKKREEDNAKAIEMNKEKGMPQLEGSEKQIALAESIRAKAVKALEDVRYKTLELMESGKMDEDSFKAAEITIEVINSTLARTSAKDWIEDSKIVGVDYGYGWLVSQVRNTAEYKALADKIAARKAAQ